jgi:hypothetical protein
MFFIRHNHPIKILRTKVLGIQNFILLLNDLLLCSLTPQQAAGNARAIVFNDFVLISTIGKPCQKSNSGPAEKTPLPLRFHLIFATLSDMHSRFQKTSGSDRRTVSGAIPIITQVPVL